MQKDELVTLLKATPSSSVSSVEVMHNPSAQYDAEGSGGIININMNRKKSEGFFFSLNNGVSYWENLRENTELSFSYTKTDSACLETITMLSGITIWTMVCTAFKKGKAIIAPHRIQTSVRLYRVI